MRVSVGVLFTILSVFAGAQSDQPAAQPASQAPTASATQNDAPADPAKSLVVPAGTKILLALKSPISTKSAQPGNGVYLETTFPVVIDGKIAIPPGTFVQGMIDRVDRPGRVKGRAAVQMHFTSLIFANGYTVTIPGSLDSVPGAEHEDVVGKEGTIREQGEKGKDATTIAGAAGTGAALGAVVGGGLKSAATGGLLGAAVGTAIAMLTRGSDIRLDTGSAVEMVLGRSLNLEQDRVLSSPTPTQYYPVQGIKPLDKPASTERGLGRPIPH